ncbi:uncharacterized protein LOC141535431 [Cotesia typhae]|uniref:uncharacterized protein LOC141535431 n=1 Tax=Cotesia typhae TaxID=2053667 RepID=UPI003D680E8E
MRTCFAQIYLQHCKAASALLSRDQAVLQTDVFLIQEPWIYRGHIMGIDTRHGQLIQCQSELNPRECIFINRRLEAIRINKLCTRDLVVALTTIQIQGVRTWLIVASAYFPYDSDEANCKEAQKEYKRNIRISKLNAWKQFCEETDKQSVVARLRRVFTSGQKMTLNGLTLPDGRETESYEEMVAHLFEDWKIAAKVITPSRVRWAVGNFDNYKSPGPDGILPALLKEGTEILLKHLLHIFRSCVALSYIPSAWRMVRVVFLPKPGKASYDQAKSFRPISLSSFLLKTLEKLIDRYIRDGTLVHKSLHDSQHAYQAGKSVETALHSVVKYVEGAFHRKQAVLGEFIDIEKAFDNTPLESIRNAVENFKIEDSITRWIHNMLRLRTVSTELSNNVEARVRRGCPQGGVSSPLMWLLVVNSLLKELNDKKIHAVGYVDDVAILVKGSHPDELRSRMQRALDHIQEWCTVRSLKVNPSKTGLVLFTKKRKFVVKAPFLFNEQLRFTEEIRYLSVTLNKKLSWRSHIASQNGEVDIRSHSSPTDHICLGSLVADTKAGHKHQGAEQGLQTNHAGYNRVNESDTYPSNGSITKCKAPESIRRISSDKSGAQTAIRRTMEKGITPASGILEVEDFKETLTLGGDRCPVRYHFRKLYQAISPTRQEWLDNAEELLVPKGLVWYTDGSSSKAGTGIGIWSNGPRTELAMRLGHTASILQAEIYAIKSCVEHIIQHNYRNRHIYICSDSRAAINSMTSIIVNSKLTYECIEALEQLAATNQVKLVWVPSHCGIHGNEMADQLAKQGAHSSSGLPTCPTPVPPSYINGYLEGYTSNRFTNLWLKAEGMHHTRAFLQGPNTKHLAKLGLTQDTKCPKCGKEDETPLHVMTGCETLERLRNEVLKAETDSINELLETGIGRLLHFAREVGLIQLSS